MQPPVPPPPGKKGKRERHTLGIDSKVHAVAIKCYDEQLPYGRDYTFRCFASSDRYNKLKSLYSSALADFFMSILLNFFVVFYCVSRETMI